MMEKSLLRWAPVPADFPSLLWPPGHQTGHPCHPSLRSSQASPKPLHLRAYPCSWWNQLERLQGKSHMGYIRHEITDRSVMNCGYIRHDLWLHQAWIVVTSGMNCGHIRHALWLHQSWIVVTSGIHCGYISLEIQLTKLKRIRTPAQTIQSFTINLW